MVDDLNHAHQFFIIRIQDRCHQHLFGAITGTFINFVQESKLRAEFLQFAFIVNIFKIYDFLP